MSAEENTSPSNENKPSRIEDILLERLQNEPKIHPQIAAPILFAIIVGIIGLGIAIYFFSRKPDKFAENPHQQQQQQNVADTAAMYSKRLKFQPMIDSLQGVIRINANDDKARLTLANVYYECEFWDQARKEYAYYLDKHPEDVDARVDYSFVIAQETGDYKAAVSEINKGLKYDPEHLNALFNAGILSVRANLDDKPKAIAEATLYFKRAKAAAIKQGNDKMASQIDEILQKIQEPAK